MDFKNILGEWKNYQKHKLIIGNMFSCVATFSCRSVVSGNLSFRGSGEERHLYFFSTRGSFTVLLSEIQGTVPEGPVIRFNLGGEETVIVQFSSEASQVAAHEAFLAFEREEFGPTPPSSEATDGSGSGSDN